jgi:hypothetical protein
MKVIASGLLALGRWPFKFLRLMRPPAPLVAIMLGASDPVVRWLLGIGHTATTAPQWCAPLMVLVRTAIGAAACASAVRQPRLTQVWSSPRSSLRRMRREAVAPVNRFVCRMPAD